MEHILCDVTLGANITEDQAAVILKHSTDLPLGSVILYASGVVAGGGGTADAYVQTKIGGDWIDIANFHFTTSSITGRYYNLTTRTVVAAKSIAAAVFTRIADNTCLDGVMGDMLRVKLITAGTAYTGASSLKVVAVAR
jgi:hypothetical protein